ncbi:hypothetical protein HIM_09767 [Hirsutella minnesotensis 3608]|uniref:Uncharacterized protein n=1 Tax=Hirsutella minnesotensis 3608 TaxID=1043627 RepID=A0A0F7ZS71_9HYPO|nr:hypothetical protein HIM_09767 [Hirsutella minnesotensis 3608]
MPRNPLTLETFSAGDSSAPVPWTTPSRLRIWQWLPRLRTTDRAAQLSNLGTWLGTRFDRTGSMDNLDRAVEVADMAVAATPQDHPDRAARLNNLGCILGMRFERTGSMEDLDRAVEVADMAVAATPQDHPDRAARLSNLGTWLGTRFER